MIKNIFLKTFFNKSLCNEVNIIKYPWGWKSNSDIKKIIEYPTKTDFINIDNDRKFIHEYRLKEFSEDLYINTYRAFLENNDFTKISLFCPELANTLNHLRSKTDINSLEEDIKIKKIKYKGDWIKYGRIKNNNKFLGYFSNDEIVHEISAGIIGPENQEIWDQKAIKQKARIIIELEKRKDVLDFERDLMIDNNEWQLSNINRILIKKIKLSI